MARLCILYWCATVMRNSYAQQNGQGQYAAGDKVTIYAGNRKGYLVDMWSASPQDKVLDHDAMDLVMDGMEATIWLKSTREVSETDKKVIAHALGDRVLAEEIDLTLFYEIDGKETQVHKTNDPLTVKITLPDSPDISYVRTYKIIRVHEGKADILPATFDTNTHELTFETDRFSAYAVVFRSAHCSKLPCA